MWMNEWLNCQVKFLHQSRPPRDSYLLRRLFRHKLRIANKLSQLFASYANQPDRVDDVYLSQHLASLLTLDQPPLFMLLITKVFNTETEGTHVLLLRRQKTRCVNLIISCVISIMNTFSEKVLVSPQRHYSLLQYRWSLSILR